MINKLSFGKIFNKKENTETQKEKQIPENLSKEEVTVLEKLRGAAAAKYLAALMGITGTAGLQSCAESEAYAYTDNSAILSALQQIADTQAKTNELLIQFMSQVDSSDKETKALIQQVISQNNKIATILTGIAGDVSQIKNAVLQIANLMEQSNKNDQELQNKIDIIINSNASDSEKLQKLIDLNTEQNSWLINISTLIGNLKTNDPELSETIKTWFEQYQNDMDEFKNNDKDHTLLMQMIFKAIQESNGISKDILDAVKDIQNSQASDSEKLAEIIDLLAGIDNKLGDILSEIRNISDKLDTMIDQNEEKNDQILNELINIKNNTGNIDAKMDQVIKNQQENNKIILNINKNTDVIVAQIKQINDKTMTLKQLQDILGPMFNEVIQELTIIDGNMVSKDEIEKILNKMDQNNDELIQEVKLIGSKMITIDQLQDLLGPMYNNVINELTIMNGNMISKDQVAQIIEKMDINTDDIIAKLQQINSNMISLEDLQAMLGPMFNEIVQELTIIDGNLIAQDELEAILEKHKVDLTKTNSLIENLTSVVKNLNIGSGGISPEDLAPIVNAINDFKNEYKAGNEAQLKAYQDIMAEIAKLNNGVQAIGTTLTELSTNFNAFAKNAGTFGDAALDELRKIREGQTTQTTAMENYFAKAQDYMVQAQQARNQQIALLQAIVDKETGSNGGITADELREILNEYGANPNDYTALLQEISDKIGNVITSDDLQNFFLKTQPDLTKTNALIETLIDVLKNKNFSITGDVNLNLSQIESQLDEMFSLLANGTSPSQDQINVLINLVQQLVDSQNGGATPAYYAPKLLSYNDKTISFEDAYAQLVAKAASDIYNA